MIAQHFLAHYRKTVYEQLARHGEHSYALAAGRESTEPGIKTYRPSPDVTFVYVPTKRTVGQIVLQPGLMKLAFDRRFDTLILLGVAWYPFTWPTALLARLMGKRVISWGHGWVTPEKGLRRLFRATFYRLFNAHLIYGHYGKELFMRYGFAPERLHVVYNSLDYPSQVAERGKVTPEELRTLRREVIGREDVPIAICTTRLTPQRRLDMLIEAAALLRDQGREVSLLLVGDGAERPKLEALAKARGVHTVFYGACYDEARLSRLIMMSNVMVAPGKVGLTAMHSLVYGTPIVTHSNADNQMPEWEAIMPGRTGSLFTDGDVKDLARAISEWVASPWPREDVRSACYEIIDRFWNPYFQKRVVDRAVAGEPGDDLFWMKEPAGPAGAETAQGAAPAAR